MSCDCVSLYQRRLRLGALAVEAVVVAVAELVERARGRQADVHQRLDVVRAREHRRRVVADASGVRNFASGKSTVLVCTCMKCAADWRDQPGTPGAVMTCGVARKVPPVRILSCWPTCATMQPGRRGAAHQLPLGLVGRRARAQVEPALVVGLRAPARPAGSRNRPPGSSVSRLKSVCSSPQTIPCSPARR